MSSIIVSPFSAFAALLIVFFLAELVAKLTKGWIPAVLVMMIFLIVGFGTGLFPSTLIEDAGVSDALFKICCGLLVVHLGTLISRKEMAAQWKTVVISLMGIAGIVLVSLTAGTALFGFDNAVAATPPLTGGAIATAMTTTAANEAGKETAALVAIVCLSLQGLLGYPLTAFCLKKEVKRLSSLYQKGEFVGQASDAVDGKVKKKGNTTFILMKLAIITVISFWIDKLTGGYVPMYVLCLLLGFAAHELKILEDDALTTANAYGLSITLLLMGLFKTLGNSSTGSIVSVAGMAVALVIMAAVAMGLISWLASKLFKQSFYMCYAIILNAFSGFPINVLLTTEAVTLNTKEGEERKAISSEMMPKMIVGGFVCVTIVSVFVAGILVRFF